MLTVPSRLVAHRGQWWPRKERQNTPDALRDALQRGWGVELDLTANSACLGGWMVAHPGDATWSALWAVLDVLDAGPGPILVNVKSQASEHVLRDMVARFGERVFAFDHDLNGLDPTLPERCPEARYLWRDFLAMPEEREARDGLWHDNHDLPTDDLRVTIDGDMPQFYVSPELHGRPLDLAFARRVLDAGAWLCTDAPHLIEALYTNPALEPVHPWWAA